MSGRVSELLRRNRHREPDPQAEAEKARKAMREWLRERDEEDVPEWEPEEAAHD